MAWSIVALENLRTWVRTRLCPPVVGAQATCIKLYALLFWCVLYRGRGVLGFSVFSPPFPPWWYPVLTSIKALPINIYHLYRGMVVSLWLNRNLLLLIRSRSKRTFFFVRSGVRVCVFIEHHRDHGGHRPRASGRALFHLALVQAGIFHNYRFHCPAIEGWSVVSHFTNRNMKAPLVQKKELLRCSTFFENGRDDYSYLESTLRMLRMLRHQYNRANYNY